jgi:transaldolase
MSGTLSERSAAPQTPAPPLLQMTETTPTVLWNDSASPSELDAALGWGAIGATCNPVIALACLNEDLPRWHQRMRDYAALHPTAGESDIGWQMVRELSAEAAALLEPIFVDHNGRNGRLSVQTDPRLYRDAAAIVDPLRTRQPRLPARPRSAAGSGSGTPSGGPRPAPARPTSKPCWAVRPRLRAR